MNQSASKSASASARLRWMPLVLLPVLVTGSLVSRADDLEISASDVRGTAVFLFEYEPRPGMRAQFEDGYRRHLDWHRAANDQLDWYAWYVSTGPRAGRFLDGAFHLAFRDFDERVDPRADRADFERNVAPFVEPIARRVYRFRPELSTAALFGEEGPTAMAEVTLISVHAGREARFEQALRELRSTLAETDEAPLFAFYQLVSGGERPSYMLWRPRHTWSDYDQTTGAGLGIGGGSSLDPALAESVERIRTETWSYRKELTYRPSRDGR